MSSFDTPAPLTKDAIKNAVAECLSENREWLRDLIQEALVEAARAEAQREADVRSALTDPAHLFPPATGRA